jgi:4'-phosphopantetheinyl transferase
MPRLTPLPTVVDCRVWLVDLDAELSSSEVDSLSETEQARAARFTFARHRARFIAGRAAVRGMLAQVTGRPERELQIGEGPHGKPFLAQVPQLQFNLSHSDGVGVLALANPQAGCTQAVGIDVELMRPVSDALALAQANFDPDECATLATLPGAARDRAFLVGWTRKEACLKAHGSGFSGAVVPHTGLDLQARAVRWNDAREGGSYKASVISFELAQVGAVVSVARLLASRVRALSRPLAEALA